MSMGGKASWSYTQPEEVSALGGGEWGAGTGC